jgi:hypothetical protein
MWDRAGTNDVHIARENLLRTKLGKQRNLLESLSVGFSTRRRRIQTPCPRCNTLQGVLTSPAVYTALAPDRFKDFWCD